MNRYEVFHYILGRNGYPFRFVIDTIVADNYAVYNGVVQFTRTDSREPVAVYSLQHITGVLPLGRSRSGVKSAD
jgi:hypothetical protein